MKLSNHLLVFDLECTANQEEEGERPVHQENNYIIEVGAVLLDRTLQRVGSYHTYVKPGEKLTPFIQNLVGVTDEQLAQYPAWDIMGPEFAEWVDHQCGLKKVRLCAWGSYFDAPQLRKAYEQINKPYPFSGTCLCAKTWAFLWASLTGHRTDKLSVGHVAELMGIVPEGKYHSAIVDAEVEAKIVQRVFSDLGQNIFVDLQNGKPYLKLKVG